MPGAFVSSSTRRDGGGREIRTPEGSPPSGFQDRRNRPLCHPSGAQYSIQARPLLIVAAAAVLPVPLVPEVGTNRRAPRGVADREPYGERKPRPADAPPPDFRGSSPCRTLSSSGVTLD